MGNRWIPDQEKKNFWPRYWSRWCQGTPSMALSQMGVPGSTSGSDGVYLRSADSGITDIDDTGRYSWTDTFYCPGGPRWAPWCRSAECQKRTLESTQVCPLSWDLSILARRRRLLTYFILFVILLWEEFNYFGIMTAYSDILYQLVMKISPMFFIIFKLYM